VEVELDALQNPRWVLSDDRAAKLLATIKTLPPTSVAPSPPNLGYKGFVLRTPGRTIRVYKGTVRVDEAGSSR
jgi:hypothetical protein